MKHKDWKKFREWRTRLNEGPAYEYAKEVKNIDLELKSETEGKVSAVFSLDLSILTSLNS